MAEIYERRLTINSHNLGRDATILLTFDAPKKGMYQSFYPIVWRVCTFGKEGSYSMQASYASQLAFLKAQVEDGNIIDAATCVNISEGETTTLTQDEEEVFHFSDPEPGTKGWMEAKNMTGFVQDIAIGFVSPGELFPTPALYFDGVGDGITAKAVMFTPKLRAYITSDYEQTAILRDAIDVPCVFEYDLGCLDESTTLNLTYERGKYKVAKVNKKF